MHDDPAALALLDTALRAAAVALLAALAGLMLRERVRQPLGRTTAALAAGLALQLLGAAPAFAARAPAWLERPLVAIAVGNAVLFWLFVRALADERFAPRRGDLAAWAVAAGASLAHCGLALRAGGAAAAASGLALRLLPLAFAALALRTMLRRRAAVDDATRALGGLLVGGGAAYVLGQQALRLATPDGRLAGPGAVADAAMLLALVAIVSWRLLRLDASSPWTLAADPALAALRRAPRARPAADADAADARLALALERLMAEHQPWRDDGLDLAALAARLGAPEYRLRRVINHRLGHRSFTAYVNGLRLAEARAALADPARRAQPVLAIALAAGFGSIGPFNRAFKAATGRTPTEFRRDELADS